MFSKLSARNAGQASGFLRHASSGRGLLFWLAAALVAGLFYLAVSAYGFGFTGFPLDDAWIHQTYARNLAYSGQLAFTPGQTSAGSTAPLWSLLLSLGYLLRLPVFGWTYGLGLVFLALTGWTVTRLGARLFPEHRWVGLLAGLFCVLEWHLIWAAVSGMETILFVWLSTFLVERYLSTGAAGVPPKMKDFGLGILGGLLILTRPEGLGLVGLVGLDMAYRARLRAGEAPFSPVDLLRRWMGVAAGVGLLLLPYVAFHMWLTGLPFPNTFYAKQAEYNIILTSFPFWWRLFGNFGPPVETVQGVFRVIFIGAQFLLLPGVLVGVWLTRQERRAELGLIWLWWTGYLLLYGFRLPVTYQHGRYQMPVIPWVILLGVWGTARLLAGGSRQSLGRRVAERALALSLVVLVPAFSVVGAGAYGRDVRFIETEMVAAARWIDDHTGPEALIAAHDIGALGYFARRPIIDLAGLITPEVIPIIRDEAALLEFITARQARYLVTFPSWYPDLTRNAALTPVYRSRAPYAVQSGGDNMVVYQIETGRDP